MNFDLNNYLMALDNDTRSYSCGSDDNSAMKVVEECYPACYNTRDSFGTNNAKGV